MKRFVEHVNRVVVVPFPWYAPQIWWKWRIEIKCEGITLAIRHISLWFQFFRQSSSCSILKWYCIGLVAATERIIFRLSTVVSKIWKYVMIFGLTHLGNCCDCKLQAIDGVTLFQRIMNIWVSTTSSATIKYNTKDFPTFAASSPNNETKTKKMWEQWYSWKTFWMLTRCGRQEDLLLRAQK